MPDKQYTYWIYYWFNTKTLPRPRNIALTLPFQLKTVEDIVKVQMHIEKKIGNFFVVIASWTELEE